MPNWTKEQQEAIDKEGTNIIVSAGAGSGKTAVLSERVLRKIKNGISPTPLNCALNALIFALNDSANAFVSLLTK